MFYKHIVKFIKDDEVININNYQNYDWMQNEVEES